MKDGAPDLMMMSLAYRAEFMKEAPEKSQSITDSMVSILGSFNHRLSALEIAMRPTQVAIHYYDRLGAKQGWRFDSNYDHKDGSGEPIPFVFVIGFGLISSTTSISGSKQRYTGISVSFRLDPSHSITGNRVTKVTIRMQEAVNFAPVDWLPHGGFGAKLYQMYHKPIILSHEELLCVVAKVISFS
ncbi:Peptidyl-prolyl cis-trans isomerase FKBP17-1, chloroplastic [Linum perenne]